MSKAKPSSKDELKKNILNQINKDGVPDFKILFSNKSLTILPRILGELLDERRQRFRSLLNTPNEEIRFEIFEDWNALDYLFGLLNHFEGVNSSDELRQIIDDFRPEYMDFANEAAFNKRYYEMFIHCRDNCTLDSEQRRIIDLSIRDFEQNGIHLPEEKQERLKEINKELAKLSFDFSNNVLDCEKVFEYHFEDDELIKEMPPDDLETARQKALADGKAGYKFTSDVTSFSAVMKYCSSGEVRKHFYAFKNTKATSGEHDNRPLILDILKLRKEESMLLGHRNYAENSLVDKMADTPEQVISLLKQVGEKARSKGIRDLQEIREYFGIEKINPWDLHYYSRILREKKYAVDEKEVKRYFEFDIALKGLFDIAEKLYGIVFEEIDISSYDPEVRVYKAFKDSEFKSYFIMDMFYRKEKRSGAWADCLREKLHIPAEDKDPIIANVCSFQKGADGKALLNLGNVRTMFHEFGHGLHVMLSESKHNELDGFHVEWDFVELPSQLMENWCREKTALKSFARDHETGEVIPDDLLEKLEKLDYFMSGIAALTQNEFGMLDMILHTEEVPASIEELDEKVFRIMQDISLFELDRDIIRFHAGFTHIFSGGYGAGYYSYLWAEIIEADVFSAFKEKGMLDPLIGKRFHDTILSQGTRKPAKELFYDFMGRDVSLEAFFRKQGF